MLGVALLAGSLGGPIAPGAPSPAKTAAPTNVGIQLVQRGPILIQGNQAFTAANGVTAGNGTAANPYVISDWQFVDSYVNQIVIEDTTAYFVIEDVYITASQGYAEILLANVTHGTVSNSQLFGGYGTPAFSLKNSSAILVNGNSLTGLSVWASGVADLVVTNNTGGGALVDTSSNVLIDWNNPGGDDIRVSGATEVTVDNNTMGTGGIFIDTSSDVAVTANNLAATGTSGIILQSCQTSTVANNVLVDRGYAGITVGGGTGATIVNNSVMGASQGITVSADHAVIQGNSVSSSTDSGLLLQGTNLSVNGNRFFHDGVLLLGAASANLATLNITTDNLVNGLPLRYYEGCVDLNVDGVTAGQIVVANCRNARIANVTVSYTQAAVQFYYVEGGLITDSNFTHNGNSPGILNYAAYVATSQFVNLTGNNFRDNNQGVIALDTDRNTTVWHNNFVHNGPYGLVYDQDGAGNRWNAGYPVGGNFWSDYVGVDACHGPLQDNCTGPDGMGDFPNWLDNYPLMRPWDVVAPPPVANFTVPADVFMALGGGGAWATVDGSPSEDAYGRILRWDWDFGDGTNLNITWASTTHIYLNYGTYRIDLTVTDEMGMANTTSRRVSVVGYPVASFTASPNPGVMNLPMIFNGSSSWDAFGTIENYTWSFPFVGPEYGPVVTYTPVNWTGGLGVTLTVVDNRSVTGETSQALMVVMDVTPPSTTLSVIGTKGSNGWYVSPVTITLSAKDGLSGVASTLVRVDSGLWTTYERPFALRDGVHTIEYHSTDRSENVEKNETSIVAVDSTPPTVRITAPEGPLPAGKVVVRWNGSDNLSGIGSYAVSVDARAFEVVGANTSITLSLASGLHTVAVRITDMAGNRATDQVTLTVSAANPVQPGAPQGGSTLLLEVVGIGAFAAAAGIAIAVFLLRRRQRARPPQQEDP